MANRKLLAEIDRLLKKVAEGVEIFEEIFEKIQDAPTPQQKEKHEGELKKEIKKLQRYRDSIKTWIASNDIKDKKNLIENRKLIEGLMERFKACEREIKTKAFSKEGLNQAAKMDPQEKEKAEMAQWVTDNVDKLGTHIDVLEAEMESVQVSMKKTKKGDNSKLERISALEHRISRHKFHITQLEIILRMLENGALTTEQVANIKEDVDYYVESSQEDDFEDYDEMYDDLNLDQEAEVFGIPLEHEEIQGSEESEKEEDLKRPVKEEKSSKSVVKSSSSITSPQVNKTPESPKAVANSTSNPSSSRSSSNANIKIDTTPPPMPSIKYAAAAASNIPETPKTEDKKTELKTTIPMAAAVTRNLSTTPSLHSLPQQNNPSSSQSPASSTTPSRLPADQNTSESRLPSSVSDLAAAFEAAKQESKKRLDLSYQQTLLDTSLQFVPEIADIERSKIYQPKQPYPTPNYYPQTSLSSFENPLMFEKFDLDTLFFIFYYRQNTFQQYLAARELKRQSWRFHTQFMTWFQRHEEPQTITDDYELGSYVYFDYEQEWCQKKKSDFKFEYQYLEDSELV